MTAVSRRLFAGGGMMLALSARASKFQTYSGPEVTRVQLFKGQRQLLLFNNTRLLRWYKVDLGFSAVGPKQLEGDGKTPEGSYVIDRCNPNSLFHLSVGISYPNEAGIAYAASFGRPGRRHLYPRRTACRDRQKGARLDGRLYFRARPGNPGNLCNGTRRNAGRHFCVRSKTGFYGSVLELLI